MNILLVEDNKTDARIVKQALEKFQVDLHIEHEGQAALEYLSNNKPDLVILDLNLMRVSGHEILQVIKKDPALSSIPVIVYTTSKDRADIKLAYSNGANAYVSKPFSLKDALKGIEALGNFWIGFVKYDK